MSPVYLYVVVALEKNLTTFQVLSSLCSCLCESSLFEHSLVLQASHSHSAPLHSTDLQDSLQMILESRNSYSAGLNEQITNLIMLLTFSLVSM